MIDIQALRQQKADLVKKNSGLLEAAETANRDLTAAENADYEANRAGLTALNGRIARAEAQMDEERSLPTSSAIQVSVPEAGKKPWASFGEQLKAVAAAQVAINMGRHSAVDPRLLASLGANETVPAEGGFLVFPEFADGLLKKSYDVGEIAKRCHHMPMNSVRMVINAVDEDSRVDGSRWGGIQSYWLAEGQTYTGTKPKFRQIQLTANKLIGLCYATEEQLADGPALESYIGQAFPDEFAFKIDDAILNGLGAGQPLGIYNSTALVVQAKDSGQSTLTLSNTNVLNMWSRLPAASRKSAIWLTNQQVEPALYQLLLAGSMATQSAILYTPMGVMGNNTPHGLLLGRPVIVVEQAPAFSSQGDLTLIDPEQYILAERNEVRADSSIHVAFLTGEQAFRFMVRIDGSPWWKKPLTPKNGSTTLSPYVALASR